MAILHSNDQMYRNGDQYYPYRQNSDLFYLSGIEQEMTVLLLAKDSDNKSHSTKSNHEEVLFIRKPDPKLETWEGRKLDQHTASRISGIRDVRWLEELEDYLGKQAGRYGTVFLNIPEQEKFKTEYPLRDERLSVDLKKKLRGMEFSSLAPLTAELRMVKSPLEIELIRKAIGITRAALERVLEFTGPGHYEYEIEAELTHEFIRRGAAGHAYPPILASGGNACILHYISNESLCREGELLLMDFGAEYANYAADCSRTLPVTGRFSARQRKLYDACLRVFYAARRLMRPGTNIDAINEEVGILWEKEHVDLGLYSTRDLKEQDKENPLYKKYFMHGTAHFLGLDVHDVGSKQQELKPGMILSCEPGIYIPDEDTGIRIENDILVTEEGYEDLMLDFPVEAEEIEQRMKH
jgi:Xaa-Pro aminopeptidase